MWFRISILSLSLSRHPELVSGSILETSAKPEEIPKQVRDDGFGFGATAWVQDEGFGSGM